MSAWGLAAAHLVVVGAGWCTTPEYVLQRLQDRLNSRALSSVVGTVDYEYLYVVQGSDAVVLLEEPPVVVPTLPDTGSTAAPASVETSPVTRVAVLDSVKDSQGRDSVVVRWTEVPAPAAPPVEATAVRPPRLTRAELPAELRQAEVAALRRELLPAVSGGEPVYLAVRPVEDDRRFPGERLTLVDQELPLAGRRLLRWQAQQWYQQWPPGSALILEHAPVAASGDRLTVPVRWSYRLPLIDPSDPRAILAEGEVVLALVRTADTWQVSQVEKLVAALQQGAAQARRPD
jgi:hypothetical protein